jgi:hypothetical protein
LRVVSVANSNTFDTVSVLVYVEFPPQTPVAIITSPQGGSIYYTSDDILFDGSSSYDPNNDPLEYKWDSNIDGTLGHVVKFFERLSEGVHVITLEVSDGSHYAHAKVVITVRPPNFPPNAVISSPQHGDVFTVGEEITFSAARSSDEDIETLRYLWDFGDSKVVPDKVLYREQPSENQSSMMRWQNESKKIVAKENREPAGESSEKLKSEGQLLYGDAANKDNDGGYYNFTNETSGTLSNASQEEFGTIEFYGLAFGKTTTHTYTEEGTYEITLVVIDKFGAFDTDSITITIQNVSEKQEVEKEESKLNWSVLLGMSLIPIICIIGIAVIIDEREKKLKGLEMVRRHKRVEVVRVKRRLKRKAIERPKVKPTIRIRPKRRPKLKRKPPGLLIKCPRCKETFRIKPSGPMKGRCPHCGAYGVIKRPVS